jgi:two-component system NarL family response regulator
MTREEITASSPIRILLADDHAVVREGIAAILGRQSDVKVVAEAGNGQEAVEAWERERPDVTLMDLRMPVMGGVEAISAIRRLHPESRFVVLTTYDGDENIYRALQAGAQAYLLKDMFREQLLEAIRTVHRGQRYIPRPIARKLADRLDGDELSAREVQVLEEIVKGRSNKEIALDLGITEPTVKFHVTNILGKLRVSDRTQAATAAIQRGFVIL